MKMWKTQINFYYYYSYDHQRPVIDLHSINVKYVDPILGWLLPTRILFIFQDASILKSIQRSLSGHGFKPNLAP